jgi:hypothetical protein
VKWGGNGHGHESSPSERQLLAMAASLLVSYTETTIRIAQRLGMNTTDAQAAYILLHGWSAEVERWSH